MSVLSPTCRPKRPGTGELVLSSNLNDPEVYYYNHNNFRNTQHARFLQIIMTLYSVRSGYCTRVFHVDIEQRAMW